MAFWLKCAIAFLAGVVTAPIITPYASAQVADARQYRGKEVGCMTGGLFSFVMPCEMNLTQYSYILVGRIVSIAEDKDNDSLQIQPEEIFCGEKKESLDVISYGGGCIPDLRTGDDWLFYLHKDSATGQLQLFYGSPSRPVDDARQEIDELRKLPSMEQAGILRGNVYDQSDAANQVPSAGHVVTAKSKSNGKMLEVKADAKGDYQFPALALGTYFVTANTTPGLWAEDGSVTIAAKSCNEVNFKLKNDSSVEGRVSSAISGPVKVWVYLSPADADDHTYWGAITQKDGSFVFRGVPPGTYVLAVTLAQQQSPVDGDAGTFYLPGGHRRAQATVIRLEKAQKLDAIHFELP